MLLKVRDSIMRVVYITHEIHIQIEMIIYFKKGISRVIYLPQRLSTIGKACVTLDHDFLSAHDKEVGIFGTDTLLLKRLSF